MQSFSDLIRLHVVEMQGSCLVWLESKFWFKSRIRLVTSNIFPTNFVIWVAYALASYILQTKSLDSESGLQNIVIKYPNIIKKSCLAKALLKGVTGSNGISSGNKLFPSRSLFKEEWYTLKLSSPRSHVKCSKTSDCHVIRVMET
jgi:hypothetical protein